MTAARWFARPCLAAGAAALAALVALVTLVAIGEVCWAATGAVVAAGPAPTAPGWVRPQAGATADAPLAAVIDRLGSTDFTARADAARTIRRAAPEAVRPLLRTAATSHRDGFVAYRALVLLTAFADSSLDDVMVSMLANPNDRLRQVAYQYLAVHPRPEHLKRLLTAADGEAAPFVRPSLMRALAAHGETAEAREALACELEGGDRLARAAVVEAAGEFSLRALHDLIAARAVPGAPLFDGAVMALGRMGDPRAASLIASVQEAAGPDAQPAIAAGFCLAGVNPEAHLAFLRRTLQYAATNPGYQPLLRAAAASLGAVAASGSEPALNAIVEVGAAARDPSRAPIALALGRVAFRNPALLLAAFERRTDLDQAARLLADAFDMLEEDYEKERFGSLLRRAYWEAAERTGPRVVAGTLIDVLEL